MQMSTSYQVLMQPLDVPIDIEMQNRFYKRRDISNDPQSYWLFEIYKMSMNVRIQSIGIATFLLTVGVFFV